MTAITVIVALLVAFLGEVVGWDGTLPAILAYGVAIGAVILSMGFVTRYLEVEPRWGSTPRIRPRPSRRRARRAGRQPDRIGVRSCVDARAAKSDNLTRN